MVRTRVRSYPKWWWRFRAINTSAYQYTEMTTEKTTNPSVKNKRANDQLPPSSAAVVTRRPCCIQFRPSSLWGNWKNSLEEGTGELPASHLEITPVSPEVIRQPSGNLLKQNSYRIPRASLLQGVVPGCRSNRVLQCRQKPTWMPVLQKR